jgi:aflatoxin B1 aldehyde reductase
MGLTPGGSTKEGIVEQWEESAKALRTDRVRSSQVNLLN